MDEASQETAQPSQEFTREQMENCDDVSQCIMFVIALAVAIILFFILREVYPMPPAEDVVETGRMPGSARFWMTVYLILAASMLYAWVYKPIRKFFSLFDKRSRRIEIIKQITKAISPLAILLGALFMGGSLGLELSEAAIPDKIEPFTNVAFLVSLFMAWKAIEYGRYAVIRKALEQRVIKDAPWRGLLKRVFIR